MKVWINKGEILPEGYPMDEAKARMERDEQRRDDRGAATGARAVTAPPADAVPAVPDAVPVVRDAVPAVPVAVPGGPGRGPGGPGRGPGGQNRRSRRPAAFCGPQGPHGSSGSEPLGQAGRRAQA